MVEKKCKICKKKYKAIGNKQYCSTECIKVSIQRRGKEYRELHKDKIKKTKDKWYRDNKEKAKEQKKQYYETNKNKARVRGKAYYEKNKDIITIRDKKYREKNKEKISDRGKDYYKKNRDKLKSKSMEYHKASKKNICIICGETASGKFCSKKCMGIGWTGENSPAWKGGKSFEPYPTTWTLALRKQIRDRDNNRCMRCGRAREEFKKALSVHHIDADKNNINFNNLITLCDHVKGSCHGLTRGKEEIFAEGFRSLLKRTYGYKYKEGLKIW